MKVELPEMERNSTAVSGWVQRLVIQSQFVSLNLRIWSPLLRYFLDKSSVTHSEKIACSSSVSSSGASIGFDADTSERVSQNPMREIPTERNMRTSQIFSSDF
ncbi:hypothetical protein [Rubritalea tangerina]|uniref:hypothetical protein n=1 Tax=Rubritalea tangerina TaxID=430798 RepID=UPI00361313ED